MEPVTPPACEYHHPNTMICHCPRVAGLSLGFSPQATAGNLARFTPMG